MSVDAVYEQLKAMIYRRELDAGQRIVERKLATTLGVSRIPLREGMIRLESEGLIRSIPHSSNYVAAIGPRDLLEIYSMREWLEPAATRLCTIRRPGGLTRSLTAICDQMSRANEAGNFSQLDDLDYRFHHAIVIGAGHSRLLRAYDAAHIRIVGFYTDFIAQRALNPDRMVQQHRQIIRWIERGDPERAEKGAQLHVRRSIVNLEKKLGVGLE